MYHDCLMYRKPHISAAILILTGVHINSYEIEAYLTIINKSVALVRFMRISKGLFRGANIYIKNIAFNYWLRNEYV